MGMFLGITNAKPCKTHGKLWSTTQHCDLDLTFLPGLWGENRDRRKRCKRLSGWPGWRGGMRGFCVILQTIESCDVLAHQKSIRSISGMNGECIAHRRRVKPSTWPLWPSQLQLGLLVSQNSEMTLLLIICQSTSLLLALLTSLPPPFTLIFAWQGVVIQGGIFKKWWVHCCPVSTLRNLAWGPALKLKPGPYASFPYTKNASTY